MKWGHTMKVILAIGMVLAGLVGAAVVCVAILVILSILVATWPEGPGDSYTTR